MGWSNPRLNPWRRRFAIAFAAVIALGNISFPLAVVLGVVN
jgi:succinate dehydrogenase / fumarate reductase cytochrome b subunit